MSRRQIIILAMVIISFGCSKENKQDSDVPDPLPVIPPPGKKWIVSTFAGNGSASVVDGPALSATFHFPEDVAVAPDGSIYVTDVLNFRIRKISNGQVSTFVGGSGFNIVDGSGTLAQFQFPYSITMDATGNLYTTDDNDPRIRKISPAPVVSTYAGIALPGFANGNADAAQFKPGGYITVDIHGNVYVSDGFNNSIRKVSVSGQVTSIAGSFPFSNPGGIAIDKDENLYVADRGSYKLLKITPDGIVTTLSGSGASGTRDGNSTEAQFSIDMRDITIDKGGNLYLSDDNRIRKVLPQGTVSTIAGSSAGFSDGDGEAAKFDYPNGLSINSEGNIYVADLNNNRVRKISFQ